MTERVGLRVAFITGGGPTAGLGHIRRSVALAGAFAAEDARILFLVSPDERVAGVSRAAGFETWQVSWETDEAAARDRVRAFGADVAVVDSYRASPEFLGSLRVAAGQVVAVDDVADRPLPVHVVVNGGVAAEALHCQGAPDTVFLLGPRYALVDPRYAEVPSRHGRDRVRRVFVSLGGGEHPETLATVLAAVEAVDDLTADVALGPFGEYSAELEEIARGSHGRVSVHRGLSDLRDLMLASDAAVSGAGMTLYELAATATPTVIVRMVDNQGPNVDGFARAGAALPGGSAGDPRLALALRSALGRLVDEPALRVTLGSRARSLVDGQGASRVAREIASLIPVRR